MPNRFALDSAYAERVYAGVLGKIIGVYVGRPFEQWSYEAIDERLGTVDGYVHDRMGVPLIAPDDDISGTFTFARAFRDSGKGYECTAADVGETWRNTILEDRTILWWGGLGASSEHTAFLRMKQGIEPPRSGSTEVNGPILSQQIGAQIFIDAWPMLTPADPDKTAHLAAEAARVSHDGVAVEAAVLLAVMESMAFVEPDLTKLREHGLRYVPTESLLRRMIDDLCEWRETTPDWREARRLFVNRYGYDKFLGGCHMIPNHGLIHLALLWGEGDFRRTITIVNTCGYDTDCNSGNVGCLLGIAQGLAAFEGDYDWRGPVADRMVVPTALGSETVTDAVRVANEIVDAARWARGEAPWKPKDGARFNFAFPGSVQGFTASEGVIRHHEGELWVESDDQTVFAGTPVFLTPEQLDARDGYGLIASSTVMPGAEFGFRVRNHGDQATRVSLAVEEFLRADQVQVRSLTGYELAPGQTADLVTPLEPCEGRPIGRVGIQVEPPTHGTAKIGIDRSLETGNARHTFRRPDHPDAQRVWRRTWTDACDEVWFQGDDISFSSNEGFGQMLQSAIDTDHLELECPKMVPFLCDSFGLVWNAQGLRRWTAALFRREGTLAIVRTDGEPKVLASCELAWEFGETLNLRVQVENGRVDVTDIQGNALLSHADAAIDSPCGAVGFLVEEGRVVFGPLSVTARKSQ